MKHRYDPECQCQRCIREAERRSTQAQEQAAQLQQARRSRRHTPKRHASAAEQYGRYLDAGPQAWDDLG